MKRILAYMGAALILVGLAQPILDVPHAPVALAEETHISNAPQKTIVVTPTPTPTPPPVVPKDNETVIWETLIGNGYSREQAAGIMGNLQQEHNFNTSDVTGGLGIAQWMGNRRANLIARGDHLNITVQAQFLIDELITTGIGNTIKGSNLYGSTLIFQDQFERCHPTYCNFSNRLMYANNILGRH